ncbi:uncharacterized protein LOC144168761 [Haemaphysalis longicornis]
MTSLQLPVFDDTRGPSLCGRDLMALLDKTGVPIGDLTAPDPTSAEPSEHMLNRLLGEFEDVFSTELGIIKGPPASLKLKETATPKFCRQFTLVTDHQPLLGLLKPDRQTPPMAAARIQRWALFLGGYQYKLQYVPGKQLLTADALSRLPAPTAAEPVVEGDPPERTPQKEGKSPSELLLGYQLRSRLDTCLPPRDENLSPCADDWTISPGSSVYVRNYGVGKRWTPGRVKSASGARMIAVDTPTGVVQRHIDQVRRPRESTPESASAGATEGAEAEGEPDSVTTPVPSPALQRTPRRKEQERSPELPAADGRNGFPTPAATEPPVVTAEHPPGAVPHQPTLRRSTRVRNPVQRFHF